MTTVDESPNTFTLENGKSMRDAAPINDRERTEMATNRKFTTLKKEGGAPLDQIQLKKAEVIRSTADTVKSFRDLAADITEAGCFRW